MSIPWGPRRFYPASCTQPEPPDKLCWVHLDTHSHMHAACTGAPLLPQLVQKEVHSWTHAHTHTHWQHTHSIAIQGIQHLFWGNITTELNLFFFSSIYFFCLKKYNSSLFMISSPAVPLQSSRWWWLPEAWWPLLLCWKVTDKHGSAKMPLILIPLRAQL